MVTYMQNCVTICPSPLILPAFQTFPAYHITCVSPLCHLSRLFYLVFTYPFVTCLSPFQFILPGFRTPVYHIAYVSPFHHNPCIYYLLSHTLWDCPFFACLPFAVLYFLLFSHSMFTVLHVYCLPCPYYVPPSDPSLIIPP